MEILQERFEQGNGDVANADIKFDKQFEEMEESMEKVEEVNGLWRKLRELYTTAARISIDLRQLLTKRMGTATSAMSIDTGDRTENEQHYLQKAPFLLNKMKNEEDKGD